MSFDLTAVDHHKTDGNEYFKAKKFGEALQSYSKALELISPTERKKKENSELTAIILSNRAACHFQLQNYEDCVSDCTSAAEICPTYPKSFYRRSQAYEALKDNKQALDGQFLFQFHLDSVFFLIDIRIVLKLDPKNKEAQQHALRLTKLIEQEQESLEKSINSRGIH